MENDDNVFDAVIVDLVDFVAIVVDCGTVFVRSGLKQILVSISVDIHGVYRITRNHVRNYVRNYVGNRGNSGV